MKDNKTHFGYKTVDSKDKVKMVGEVFSSVAKSYDIMNDLMSLGVHRLWKRHAIGALSLRPGQRVLDLAGGTGDLTARIAPKVGEKGQVVIADINAEMLNVGVSRLLDKGVFSNVEAVQLNAEQLSFSDNYFDRIIIGFGLRNVTDKSKALGEMCRVLKPGGKCLVLEFSKPVVPGLAPIYDAYSFKLLPWVGEKVAKDKASYQYLAESIRMHPGQDELKQMMLDAGFDDCKVENLSGGIVAMHIARKY